MTFQRLRMLVRFVTCFLILLAVAVQRNGSVFGHDVSVVETTDEENSPVVTHDGVTTTINTTTIANNIKGYGGPVPLEITIKDDKILDIKTLENSETEGFFERVRSGVIPKWIGTPVNEVADKEVDGITGATLSSRAVDATIKTGVAHYQANSEAIKQKLAANGGFVFSVRNIAVLIVVLCAAILPIFIHDIRYRYIQLALNVIVLGFWSGTFLSYEVFVNYISNGANLMQSLAVLLMLVIAFVYPYFGRKSHYCTWVCPLGSLQELVGKTTKFKLKMSPKLVKGLTIFQECLWFVLMFVMCAGIWFEWMDWELFTAFIFKQAAIGVLIAAVLFIALSVVIPRPYCRFVCPTGCLFQITQNADK